MEKTRLNILISAELIDRVQASADKDKRTKTAQVEVLLEMALDALKKGGKR